MPAAVAREQGFYAAFGERNQDVGSISAPVFDHTGRLACAVGLGFPTQRIGPGDVARLASVVARAGQEASYALGYERQGDWPKMP
ncbi:IclR family transcriptional regulator domain-containing protein [Paenarthrobacter aurescens]|uniref:IclR family transcriptional regulator domain-containing protein n=1 Tax=Paenarthrobacter aurescens TaxID=43663 RepID=UPI0034D1A3EC